MLLLKLTILVIHCCSDTHNVKLKGICAGLLNYLCKILPLSIAEAIDTCNNWNAAEALALLNKVHILLQHCRAHITLHIIQFLCMHAALINLGSL